MSEEQKKDFEEAMVARQQVEQKILVKAWDDARYKQELTSDPTAAIEKELGSKLPEGCKYEIIEEQPGTLEIVLPRLARPAEATEELSDEALEQVAGGSIVVAGNRSWNAVYAVATRTSRGYVIFIGF